MCDGVSVSEDKFYLSNSDCIMNSNSFFNKKLYQIPLFKEDYEISYLICVFIFIKRNWFL